MSVNTSETSNASDIFDRSKVVMLTIYEYNSLLRYQFHSKTFELIKRVVDNKLVSEQIEVYKYTNALTGNVDTFYFPQRIIADYKNHLICVY